MRRRGSSGCTASGHTSSSCAPNSGLDGAPCFMLPSQPHLQPPVVSSPASTPFPGTPLLMPTCQLPPPTCECALHQLPPVEPQRHSQRVVPLAHLGIDSMGHLQDLTCGQGGVQWVRAHSHGVDYHHHQTRNQGGAGCVSAHNHGMGHLQNPAGGQTGPGWSG